MNIIKKGGGAASPSIKVLGYIGEKIPIINKKIENKVQIENKVPIINYINIKLEGNDDLIDNLKQNDIIEIESTTISEKIDGRAFFLEEYNGYENFFKKKTKYLFKVLGYFMNYYFKNYILLYSFNSGAICKLSFQNSKIYIKKYDIDKLDNIYKFNIKSLKDKKKLKYKNKELCVENKYIYEYYDEIHEKVKKINKNQYCPLLESFNKDYFKRYTEFYSEYKFYRGTYKFGYIIYKVKFENNGTKKEENKKIRTNNKTNNNNNNNNNYINNN
jgi:hypothetical protein